MEIVLAVPHAHLLIKVVGRVVTDRRTTLALLIVLGTKLIDAAIFNSAFRPVERNRCIDTRALPADESQCQQAYCKCTITRYRHVYGIYTSAR